MLTRRLIPLAALVPLLLAPGCTGPSDPPREPGGSAGAKAKSDRPLVAPREEAPDALGGGGYAGWPAWSRTGSRW